MAFSSAVTRPAGQQEARYGPTGQEGHFQSTTVLPVRTPAAVPAFLRVHFLSSQRMLSFPRKRKEPAVAGCVGCELSGIFGMPPSQLWERGMRLRFPARGQRVDITAAVGGHGWEIQDLRKLEGRNHTWDFNTSGFQKCASFPKEILRSIYSVLRNSMFYKILL